MDVESSSSSSGDIELRPLSRSKDPHQGADTTSTDTSSSDDDAMLMAEADNNDDDDDTVSHIPPPLSARSDSMFGETNEKMHAIPIKIEFSNLFYSVRQMKGPVKQVKQGKNPFEKENKYILKDLYATFLPNQFTVIMGPSGAGKTTLLNLIAGRTSSGKVEGKVKVNGVPRKKISLSKWRKLVAYVMQDDILHGDLTTRETFTFTAALRLPRAAIHPSVCKRRVQYIIEELGLEDCSSTRIGTPASRGVSGGQRKRVSIGVEMITEPSVLFLDEPTTGLDSSTSYTLTLTLQKLAHMGRNIVATIHQPSSDMFDHFDRIIFMSRGHILYNGPAKDMVPYFSKVGYVCPRYTNPCEFVMSLASEDSHISSEEEGTDRLRKLVNAYRSHSGLVEWDYGQPDEPNHKILKEAGKARLKAAKLAEQDKGEADEELPTRFKPQKSSNWLVQFILLYIRQSILNIRNKTTTYVRLIQTIFLALLVGILYQGIGDDQSSIQDRQGALFFITIVVAMGPLMLANSVFPVERLIFVREHSTGSYSTHPFFLARALSELPYNIVFPLITSVIAYWFVGFDNTAAKFFIFYSALVLESNCAQALGLAISAAWKNAQVSLALSPVVFTPLMLLGGLFLNEGNVPDWLIWAKYLSPMKYCFEVLVLNEMDGLTFTCSQAQRDKHAGSCPIANGHEAIVALAMDDPEQSIWASSLLQLALFFFYSFVAWLLLSLTAGRQKGA
eukprot:TRINITY_DN1458_c0_g1_i3.p1 TRINITY_DN1458_c0_g1~~TRINITY_DN1458_c0_g1_i3.p1  ORF type:complete len:729 (+),score=90.59 TRINITY_DN1458_c0_g1_i3:131-2317(+)